MSKTYWLHAVSLVAVLAAVPAFAQTETPEAGMKLPNGSLNPAVSQPGQTGKPGPATDSAGSASMAPKHKSGRSMASKSKTDTDASATADTHYSHRASMTRSERTARGSTDTSQDAAVDRLNDQSYQAAGKGMPGPSGTMPSSSSSAGTAGKMSK